MSDEGGGRRRDSDAGEVDDPFDSLEEPAAEVDDPFAELGAGVEGDDPDGGDPDGGDPDGNDPDGGASDSDPVDPAPVDPESGASGARRDDPFDELGPADPGADVDDAFERMDVGGPAEEDVWESLDADAAGTDALGGATAVPGGGDTEHVVSKRTYCQQCPHFTPPPEVACGHEGTTILEAVGFDEFRVRNCPMVSEEDPTFDSGE